MSASFGRRDVPVGVPLVTEPELDTALLDYVPDSAAWTPATPKTYVSWPDSTADNPDFRLQMGGTTFNSTYDPVFYQGFNVDNGTPVDASKHLATWNIEYDYNDGSKRVTEFYWEWRKSTSFVRPFSSQIDNSTEDVRSAVDLGDGAASYFNVESSQAAVTYFKVTPTYVASMRPLSVIGTAPSLTMGDGTADNDLLFTLNYKSGQSGKLVFSVAGSQKWWFYNIGGDANMYLRDVTNSLMHMTMVPGSGTTGETRLTGGLKVGGNVGFYGTSPAAKPTVTGSRGSNAALASLLTALAGLGLLTDSSS